MRAGIFRLYRAATGSRRISTFAMGFVSLLILGWLVYKGYPYLKEYHWDIRWEYLPIIFGVYSIDLLIVVFLWSLILWALGNRDRFLTHLRRYTVSNLARRLPGTIWYIAYRAQAYKNGGLSPATTTAAVTMEAAISIAAAVIVTSIFAAEALQAYRAGPWAAAGALIVCLLLLYPGTLKWLLKSANAPQTDVRYRNLLIWISGHAVVWILGGVLLFNILQLFYPLEISKLGFIIGCFSLTGLISRALIFLPTNLGFTEVSLSVMLSTIVPPSIAVIAALANRILVTIMELLWVIAGKFASTSQANSDINP